MRARVIFPLLFTFFFAASCAAKPPIRIGFAADLSGPNPAIGVDGRDGAILAAEKLNAAGGINGRQIELVIRDAKGSPEGAAEAVRQLIQEEGLLVIFAHMPSSLTLAAWEAHKDSGALFFSPTTSASALAGLDDNFVRLTPTTSAFSERLAAYAAQKMKFKTYGVLYDTDNAAFTESYKDSFKAKAAESGGATLWEYGFSSKARPEIHPIAEYFRTSCPEALLVIASAADTAWLAQQARLNGCAAHLLTSNWALTQDLIQNGGQAVDGIIAVATYNENNRSPQYLNFSSAFEERFGKSPSFSAGYAYESMLFLVEALKKTGGEKEGLKRALLGIQDFKGVFGSLSLDPYGDVKRTLYVVTVREGRFFTKAVFQEP